MKISIFTAEKNLCIAWSCFIIICSVFSCVQYRCVLLQVGGWEDRVFADDALRGMSVAAVARTDANVAGDARPS